MLHQDRDAPSLGAAKMSLKRGNALVAERAGAARDHPAMKLGHARGGCPFARREGKDVEVPLTLQILKTSALSAERVEFSGRLVNYAEYGFEVLGEEFSVVMRHELWGIEPAGYRQEYPFIVALVMIVGVLFRPLKRRWARS